MDQYSIYTIYAVGDKTARNSNFAVGYLDYT